MLLEEFAGDFITEENSKLRLHRTAYFNATFRRIGEALHCPRFSLLL
jgi:hypothetical protein